MLGGVVVCLRGNTGGGSVVLNDYCDGEVFNRYCEGGEI